MIGKLGERYPGVEPARGRHHVCRTSADAVRLQAGLRVRVDRCPPPREPDENDSAGLEPPNHALDSRETVAVVVLRELTCADRRPLHEVGEADPMVAVRVPRIPIT